MTANTQDLKYQRRYEAVADIRARVDEEAARTQFNWGHVGDLLHVADELEQLTTFWNLAIQIEDAMPPDDEDEEKAPDAIATADGPHTVLADVWYWPQGVPAFGVHQNGELGWIVTHAVRRSGGCCARRRLAGRW